MGLTEIFKRHRSDNSAAHVLQTGRSTNQPFTSIDSYVPLSSTQFALYKELREAIPVIDAAIFKLVRLIGNFEPVCDDKCAQKALNDFLSNVQVNGNTHGISTFISTYFENLLTYGTSIGEIVTDKNGNFYGLYNADLSDIVLKRNPNGFDVDVYLTDGAKSKKVERPQFILLSALNPDPGKIAGNSLLKGLPFVSSILLKIFNTIGTNWDRVGNVRFAVTYKPQNDSYEKSFAKERAMQIANEWSSVQSSKDVKDFIAVGDVDIKVIGADNQILDSEIPVRQMLEQIVAKTGLPPFILGLSWSTTERMSSQQSDILTSELESYRKILEPVILKICNTFLRMNGYCCETELVWEEIMLQDISELSKSRLYNAQAHNIEIQNSKE